MEVDVGVMTTVVTTKTVLLASCVVVGDRELTGVVDEIVDEVVDVFEVWEVDEDSGVIELVVVGDVGIWLESMVVEEEVEEEIEEEVNEVVVVKSVGRRLVRFGWGNANGRRGWRKTHR